MSGVTPLDSSAVARLRAIASGPGPGDVLGDRFELREPIGEGAMGTVHAAWDRELGREVAVKTVRLADERAAQRFAREASALASVSHPAVVPYVAHGANEGVGFLVTERLVGHTLAEELARGRLSPGATIAVGRRLAEGLAELHHANLVHRDVKPSNVFLAKGAAEGACLLDFGLVRDAAGPTLTSTGAAVGTPGYMAPEQARGETPAGPPADIFALGCVLFECLAGRAAFRADTTEALVAKILLEEPPSLLEACAAAPPGLDALLRGMMSKDDHERPDAAEVARTLAGIPLEAGGSAPEPDAARSPASEGAVIAGKYRVEGLVGEGGMGIVLAARHIELGKRVAIKLLSQSGSDHAARFLREARAAARLESEHVARVLDVGRTDDGTPYIVMEHLTGEDLGRHLRTSGPLGVRQASRCVIEACEALSEAHALGIVHRDVKPSNLFLARRRDGSDCVKVLDFGISKVSGGVDGTTESLTMTGERVVLGSVPYMSPEQLDGAGRVDERTDVWSLGVVAYELMTGVRPFEGGSAATIGARIAAATPRPLHELLPEAPAGLEQVLLRCLEKDPERRFPDVGALAGALAPFAEGLAPQPARPRPRTRRLAFAVVAGVVVAGAGSVAVWLAVPARRLSTAVETTPSPSTSPVSAAAPVALPAASTAPTSDPAMVPPAVSTTTPAARARAERVPPPTEPRPTAKGSAPVPTGSAPTRRDLDLRDPALEGR